MRSVMGLGFRTLGPFRVQGLGIKEDIGYKQLPPFPRHEAQIGRGRSLKVLGIP